MKYVQPYGVSDPEAPYINGNPTTGTMGSIPPAASIEHPQREVVNFIKDSGITPDEADLRQLAKSVQGGVVNYATDAGTPNFIAITLTPAISEYILGQRFEIKVAYDNTTMVRINANGVGNVPLVHSDGSELGAGEVRAGGIILVAYDGAGHFQLLTGGGPGLIMMTAQRHLYVDDGIGSDTAYDGSSSVVSTVHGPFKTLKHAIEVMLTYNLGGWAFVIHMANGTYNWAETLVLPIPNGSGIVYIVGNQADPSQVKLINNNTGTCIYVPSGGTYSLDGVWLQTTAPNQYDPTHCLWISGGASVQLWNVAFGYSTTWHILVGPGGTLGVVGPISIYGNAYGHMIATQNGTITFFGAPLPTLKIKNNVTFTGCFIGASQGGQTWSPYAAINYEGGAVVTGKKFSADANGVINSSGRGVGYYPGNVAGTMTLGGQYL